MAQQFVWEGTGKTNIDIAREIRAFNRSRPKEEIDDRGAGLYFTFMESVWDADSFAPIRVSDFDAIKRSKNQGMLLKTCYEYLESDIRDPDYTSGTANQNQNKIKLDCFGNLNAEAAHLLSRAEVCHKAFVYLGEAAVGVEVDSDEAIRSTPGDSKLKRRKILVGVKAGKHFTSLKGHKFNKTYCSEQKTYFDSEDPSMIVVPCSLTFAEVMHWASSKETAIDYDCLVLSFGTNGAAAAMKVLRNVPGECSPSEIDSARELLTTFVKGVAGGLKGNDVLESFTSVDLTNSKNASLLRWSKLVGEIKSNPDAQIGIPKARSGFNTAEDSKDAEDGNGTAEEGNDAEEIRVGKVRMTTGNSLPDPWLLLVKSAINYSAFRKTKLMPACPPLEDEDEDDGPPNTTQCTDYGDMNNFVASSPLERESFLVDSLKRGDLLHA